METEKNYYSRWIDSLKGIAILMVISAHTGLSGMPSYIGRFGSIGPNGVQLFFIISSYLTFKSYKRNNTSYMSWISRKIVRLIPNYYLALIIYSIVKGGSSYWLGSLGHITAGNVFAHLLFVHGLFPHYVDSILSVEWYIGTLVIFYLITPVLSKFIRSLTDAVIVFIVASPIIEVINSIIINRLPQTDTYIYRSFFEDFWVVTQFPVWLCGIIFYYLIIRIREIQCKKSLSFTGIILAIILLTGIALGKNNILGYNRYCLLGMAFLLLVVSTYLYNFKVIDNFMFASLGKYSYGIYLSHFLIGWIYSNIEKGEIGSSFWRWSIKFIVVTVISLFVSVLLTNYFEKPIILLLQQWKDRNEKKCYIHSRNQKSDV